MLRPALFAWLLVSTSAAEAQVQLSDFAGLWQTSGARMGPGGTANAPPGPPRRLADDASSLSLGGPPPMRAGERLDMSDADAALGLDMGDIRVREAMTPAGRARFAAFNPADHPMYHCISPGLPTVMMMPGLQDWSVVGERLIIRHDVWQEPRAVSVSERPLREAGHSRQGQATAEIRDGALVSRTIHLTEAWGALSRHAPGSAERAVVETYRLEGKDMIRGLIEISDPLYLTRTLSRPLLLRRAPAGVSFETFPCEIAPYGMLAKH